MNIYRISGATVTEVTDIDSFIDAYRCNTKLFRNEIPTAGVDSSSTAKTGKARLEKVRRDGRREYKPGKTRIQRLSRVLATVLLIEASKSIFDVQQICLCHNNRLDLQLYDDDDDEQVKRYRN